MPSKRNTIPIEEAAPSPDWKNRFPGAVSFVETLDTSEESSDSGDILSFESLREAFATLNTAETELVKTIPEIELSAESEPELTEQPDYGLTGEIGSGEIIEKRLTVENDAVIDRNLRTVIEAMLFVGNRENQPLAAERIAEKIRNVSAEEVDQEIVRINEHYRNRNCPYSIVSSSHGYQMMLRSEFDSVRTNFYGKIREVRLSQQAIDTLAVIAYRQPITAEEVQTIRQQPSSALLSQLVRRGLLQISREASDKKKTVLYYTSPRFLELFNMRSIEDIPKAEEFD